MKFPFHSYTRDGVEIIPGMMVYCRNIIEIIQKEYDRAKKEEC